MTHQKFATLADRLQHIIESRNLSHNDVARLCGIKQGSVSYILAKNLNRSKLALEMANGLNVSYNWLTTGKGSMKPQSIHQIPLFDNIFDCIKFARNKDTDMIENYIYSEQDAFAGECFALSLDDRVILICSFAKTVKQFCGLYLNIDNVLEGSVNLSREPLSDASFPVVEFRSNYFVKEDHIHIKGLSSD
ncbi:MAG: helix-turn-helix domain-containing protein [Francisellaceae bacterium]